MAVIKYTIVLSFGEIQLAITMGVRMEWRGEDRSSWLKGPVKAGESENEF